MLSSKYFGLHNNKHCSNILYLSLTTPGLCDKHEKPAYYHTLDP